jgi:hypothetical protein
MKAGARLIELAGVHGRAGVLMLRLAAGPTSGAALVERSTAPVGSPAWVHLLSSALSPPPIAPRPPPSTLPYTRGRMRLTPAQVWRDRYYRTG